MTVSATGAFSALADPTRRRILTLLSERDHANVTEIAAEFPEITRAAVSTHLRVLRQAELVQERRVGQFREYSLGTHTVDDIVGYLRSIYQLDSSRPRGPRRPRS
jgi:DNA-binding transcriptional ArsR family regulator